MSRIPSHCGLFRVQRQRKLQNIIILSGTHPLMGRGGCRRADQVLTFHEVPIIGHASFERQRRRNVGDVGAGHTIELQVCKDQHWVSSFSNWIKSKDPDSYLSSYGVDTAVTLHTRYLCLCLHLCYLNDALFLIENDFYFRFPAKIFRAQQM